MILPQQNKETGEYHLSYSQISLWNDFKGFNTGRLGKEEYIRHYFFGEQYDDKQGWAQFGREVEDYITLRKGADNFTEHERTVLETIEPLGNFQFEAKIPFEGFNVKGYLDDATPDFTKIRDYKTASEKSSQKYYGADYKQLDIYALQVYKTHGFIPQMEVCVIEREGNPFRGGGRSVLKVKDKVWYIPRTTTLEKLTELEAYINRTAQEISDAYTIFLNLNK